MGLELFMFTSWLIGISVRVVSVAQSVSAFGCYLNLVTERLVVQAHPRRLFSSLFFSFFVTKAARTLDTLFPRRRLEFLDVNVH